jgi:hypothetical protein
LKEGIYREGNGLLRDFGQRRKMTDGWDPLSAREGEKTVPIRDAG